MENLPTSLAAFSLNSPSSTNRNCQQESQQSLGYCNSRSRVEAIGGVPAHQTSSSMASAHTAAWLAALHAHNNNTEKCLEKSATASSWRCYSYESDKLCDSSMISSHQDGSGDNACYYPLKNNESAKATDCIESIQQSAIENPNYESYDLCGATSLTAGPLLEDQLDVSELAAGGVSNHTSLNNSTENLSYISDNSYDDDVIILGEHAEGQCEDLSLNSDDCIYAYRGEGADEFGLTLKPILGATGRFGHLNTNNATDEETDFLEMDFEPDPLSELEYNNDVMANVDSSLTKSPALVSEKHFLKARARDELFSLPIDDMGTQVAPPIKALQNQSLSSKNFGGISMHLDQIQKDYVDPSETPRERLNSALNSAHHPEKEEGFGYGAAADEKRISAHSLPNTIQEHFNSRSISESAVVNSNEDCLLTPSTKLAYKSPSKVTGAKPKLLSTFSSTSSTSSKNSSKSRNSLRSSFIPPLLGNSNSFDERSVSCSEFRIDYDQTVNNRRHNLSAPRTSPSTLATLTTDYNALNLNDETCLDCLEKEFLSNTIGKILDTNHCSKCHKRIGYSKTFSLSETGRYRRSTSPTSTFFQNENITPTTTPITQFYLNDICNFQARQYSRENWDVNLNQNFSKHGMQRNALMRNSFDFHEVNNDNNAFHIVNNKAKPSDFATVSISTKNITEADISQALDKLQISFSRELLHHYLKSIDTTSSSSTSSKSSSSGGSSNSTVKTYENLLQFLLHASKSQCNYKKLKTIIKACTKEELNIQFKEDNKINDVEMLPVRVSDILLHWLHCPNLAVLKNLDKRFQDCNILGKIANLIRQSQHRCSARRPLPEFISIPQYYPSGYLILTTRTPKTTSNYFKK